MTSREQPARPGKPIDRSARSGNRDLNTLHKSLHRLHGTGPLNTDDAMGGITAHPYPILAIFEIPELQGSSSSGETTGTWLYDATGWAYMADARRVWSSDGSYEAADTYTATIWHPTGYPDTHRSPLQSLHSSAGLWPARFGGGDWVWCHFNEQSGRWEVLQGYQDIWRFQTADIITQGGTGTVYLILAEPNTADYVVTNLTFEVTDSLELGPLDQGERGAAKRFGDSNRWEILAAQSGGSGVEIVKAKLANSLPDSGSSSSSSSGAAGCVGLLPGESKACRIYAFDFATCLYVYLDNGTLRDVHGQNCVMPEEEVMGILRSCPSGYNVDILGSHGLVRPALALDTLDCDETSGEAEIYLIGDPSLQVTSSSGSVSSSSGWTTGCDATASGCTVRFCAHWGYADVEADDKIRIHYVGGQWLLIPGPKPRMAKAILAEVMCADNNQSSSGFDQNPETVDITGFVTTDYCSDLVVTTVRNPLRLKGQAGSEVHLRYDRVLRAWTVENVLHHTEMVKVDNREDSQCIEEAWMEIAVQRCDPTLVWEDLICGVDCSSSSGG